MRIGASFHLALGSSGAVMMSGLSRQEVQEVLERAPDECWAHRIAPTFAAGLRSCRRRGGVPTWALMSQENLLQQEAKMMKLEKLIAQRESVSTQAFPVPVKERKKKETP